MAGKVQDRIAVDEAGFEVSAQQNPISEHYNRAFSDFRFFIALICVTATAVLTALGGSLDIVLTLFAVFMFLIFTSAKFSDISYKALHFSSYILRILFIFIWVLSVVALLLTAASIIGIDFFADFLNATYEMEIQKFFSDAFSLAGAAIMFILALLTFSIASALIFANYLFISPMRKLAKGFCISLKTGEDRLPPLGKIRLLLTVVGGAYVIGAVGGLPLSNMSKLLREIGRTKADNYISATAMLLTGIAYLVLQDWLRKNFKKER